MQSGLLVVEHAGGAGDDGVFQAGDFGHGTFGREVAFEDGQVTLLVHGAVDGVDDALLGRLVGHVFEHLGDGLAADGDAVTVQQASVEQDLHDLGNATGFVQVHRQGFAAGLEVAQHGGALADALEIVDGPLHACAVRDGQEVQHGVGRAAGGHDDGHGVFNRFFGDDVAGLEVHLDGFDQDFRRLFGRIDFFVVNVGHGRRVGQRNAQGFKGRRHGVGGVHAAARAGARNRALLDFAQVFVAEFAGGVFAHGFKHADDVEVFALVVAGQDGAAVHINGGHVGAQHAHEAAGHVFVAATDDQNAVHPLALHAGFDAVRNHLAADQRVLHAFGAHGHAVGDGGGAENLGVAACGFDARHRRVGEFLQAAVARRDGAVAVGHADHGLAKVAFLVAHAVVHGAVGRAGFAFGDVGAAAVDRLDRNDFVVGHGVLCGWG